MLVTLLSYGAAIALLVLPGGGVLLTAIATVRWWRRRRLPARKPMARVIPLRAYQPANSEVFDGGDAA